MLIKEILGRAIDNELIDLQALITFLAFEKEVISMNDDESCLDLYFLDKHKNRMSKELHAYKSKMNMEENSCAWEVHTEQKERLYVYAQNELQAKTYAITIGYVPTKILYVPNDLLMSYNDSFVRMKDIIKGLQAPTLIGSFK